VPERANTDFKPENHPLQEFTELASGKFAGVRTSEVRLFKNSNNQWSASKTLNLHYFVLLRAEGVASEEVDGLLKQQHQAKKQEFRLCKSYHHCS